MPAFLPYAMFTDGAVLCRDKEIRLFGEAPNGTAVTAVLLDSQGNELARDSVPAREGRFLLLLPPQKARTGCVLRFSDGQDAGAFFRALHAAF